MGLRNTRAICPNCGGKIHTQPRGMGHLTWANSGPLVQTGTECQHCGTALSGKVGLDNKAIAADDPRAVKAQEKEQARRDIDAAVLEALAEEPLTLGEIKERFGLSQMQVTGVAMRIGSRVKAKGFGKQRRFELVS